MRKFIMVAAAAAMVTGSSVAQAAPIADVRSSSPVAGTEEIAGTPSAELLVLGLAFILLAIAIWGINDNDADDGFPTSP